MLINGAVLADMWLDAITHGVVWGVAIGGVAHFFGLLISSLRVIITSLTS